MNTKLKRAGILIAICAAAAGCDKVNKENYDQLKMGMPYPEIVQLLGEPTRCDSLLMAKSCTWGKEPKVITVNFVDDKTILFTGSGL